MSMVVSVPMAVAPYNLSALAPMVVSVSMVVSGSMVASEPTGVGASEPTTVLRWKVPSASALLQVAQREAQK